MDDLTDLNPQQKNDVESELMVLACLAKDRATYYQVGGRLQPKHFYGAQAAAAYKVFVEMSSMGDAPDYLAWRRRLMSEGVIDGESDVLAIAMRIVPLDVDLPEAISHHAENVITWYMKRGMRQMADKMVTLSDEESANSETVQEFIQDTIGDFMLDTGMVEISTMGRMIESYDEMTRRIRSGQQVRVSTVFDDLDVLLSGGMSEAELVIVAARPGMGKTSFMAAPALKVAEDGGVVVWVDREMSDATLYARFLSQVSGMPLSQAMKGEMPVDDERLAKYEHARGRLDRMDTCLYRTWDGNVDALLPMLRAMKAAHGLTLVVVDYLQLMWTTRGMKNRVQEIGHITRTLKLAAQSLGVPFLVASQLSRGVEERKDKRPKLHDLRDSGDIEQDADVVIFLYRDDYYNHESERPNIAEVLVEKNRHGPTGAVDLYWDSQRARFKNLQRKPLVL